MNLARIRKAIAAGLAPFLALPVASIVAGDVALDSATFWGAVLGAFSGVVTYYVPNASAPR